MIIELTGIPGAGKSTIISEIGKSKLAKPIVLNIEKYIRSISVLNIPTKVGFDIMLFFSFYKLKRVDYTILLRLIFYLDFKINSLFVSLNIYRNIYKKLVIHRLIQAENKIFIVDEGLSHIPMSLFVNINKKILKSDVINFLKILPKADRVILIDVENEELIKRVLKRGSKGHRRIDFTKTSNVYLFINKSREVAEILKQELNPLIHINNTKIPNIKNIIKIMSI